MAGPRSTSPREQARAVSAWPIPVSEPAWGALELADRVRAIFASPDYRPPSLPQVALEVLALSHRRDVDLRDIAALVERDLVIAARLLKVASSPLYRGSTPVRSVRDCVQRLGLSTLRDLLLAEGMNLRLFRAGTSYAAALDELRIHATATAHLARLVCNETAIDAEYAFLCGLLHDIGLAAILLAVGDGSRGARPPSLDLLWPIAEAAHAAVGGQVARMWNLPADVALVIEHHGAVLVDGRLHPLVAAVQIAEELAMARGVGLLPKLGGGLAYVEIDRLDPEQLALAREALHLDEAAMVRLTEGAAAIIGGLTGPDLA